jgi:hypothetical protein
MDGSNGECSIRVSWVQLRLRLDPASSASPLAPVFSNLKFSHLKSQTKKPPLARRVAFFAIRKTLFSLQSI